MTDKETTQWFDTIFYGGKDKPMMLATEKVAKQSGALYYPAYTYVVVDPEELEMCTLHKSETHGVSLINTGQHMGLCIGDTYLQLGPPNKDGDAKVYEGTGLLCVIRNNILASNVTMYDIRHGILVTLHLTHKNPEAKKVSDKIRKIIDNDKDVTAGQMYRQLFTWYGDTSIVYIYNAERDWWTLLDFGYLSPESLEAYALANLGHRKAYNIRTGKQEI